MKCSICGTESKGDARFCSGCGATLVLPKTDETMLDLRTALFRRPVIVPAAPPGSAAAAPPHVPAASRIQISASAPTTIARPGSSSSNTGGIVLVLIALAIIGYFVYQVATSYGASWIAALSGASPAPTQSTPPTRPVPPAATPTQLPEQESAPPVAAAPVPPILAPTTPKVTPAPGSTVAKPRPATAKGPAKPPASSRWQDMKEAFGRCAKENIVSRVACEQRVELLYCSGYWGKVTQCPEARNPYSVR